MKFVTSMVAFVAAVHAQPEEVDLTNIDPSTLDPALLAQLNGGVAIDPSEIDLSTIDTSSLPPEVLAQLTGGDAIAETTQPIDSSSLDLSTIDLTNLDPALVAQLQSGEPIDPSTLDPAVLAELTGGDATIQPTQAIDASGLDPSLLPLADLASTGPSFSGLSPLEYYWDAETQEVILPNGVSVDQDGSLYVDPNVWPSDSLPQGVQIGPLNELYVENEEDVAGLSGQQYDHLTLGENGAVQIDYEYLEDIFGSATSAVTPVEGSAETDTTNTTTSRDTTTNTSDASSAQDAQSTEQSQSNSSQSSNADAFNGGRNPSPAQSGSQCISAPQVDPSELYSAKIGIVQDLDSQIASLQSQIDAARRCDAYQNRVFRDVLELDGFDYKTWTIPSLEQSYINQAEDLQTQIDELNNNVNLVWPSAISLNDADLILQTDLTEAAQGNLDTYADLKTFYDQFDGDLETLVIAAGLDSTAEPIDTDAINAQIAQKEAEIGNKNDLIVGYEQQKANLDFLISNLERQLQINPSQSTADALDTVRNNAAAEEQKIENANAEIEILNREIEDLRASLEPPVVVDPTGVAGSVTLSPETAQQVLDEVQIVRDIETYEGSVALALAAFDPSTTLGFTQVQLGLINTINTWSIAQFSTNEAAADTAFDERSSPVNPQDATLTSVLQATDPESFALVLTYLDRVTGLTDAQYEALQTTIDLGVAQGDEEAVYEYYNNLTPVRFDLDEFLDRFIEAQRQLAQETYDGEVEQRQIDLEARALQPLTSDELDQLQANFDIAEGLAEDALNAYEDAQAALAEYDDVVALRTDLAQLALNSAAAADQLLIVSDPELLDQEIARLQGILDAARDEYELEANNFTDYQAQLDQDLFVNAYGDASATAEAINTIRSRFSSDINAANQRCNAQQAIVNSLQSEVNSVRQQIAVLEADKAEVEALRTDYSNVYCEETIFTEAVFADYQDQIDAIDLLIQPLLDSLELGDQSLETQLADAQGLISQECEDRDLVQAEIVAVYTPYLQEELDISDLSVTYDAWGELGSWDLEAISVTQLPCAVSSFEVLDLYADIPNVLDAPSFMSCTGVILPSPDASIADGDFGTRWNEWSETVILYDLVGLQAQIDADQALYDAGPAELLSLGDELLRLQGLIPQNYLDAASFVATAEDCGMSNIAGWQGQINSLQVQETTASAEAVEAGEDFWDWLSVDADERIAEIDQAVSDATTALDKDNTALFPKQTIGNLNLSVLSSRRRLQTSYTANDLEIIDQLSSSDRPSKIRICVDQGTGFVQGFIMFYGTGANEVTGEVHGQPTGCTDYALTQKVVEVAFYGNSAPYSDGIALELSNGSTISAGVTSGSGLQVRKAYYPSNNGGASSTYDYEFFGFQTQTRSGVLESISLVSYDEAEFVQNKQTIENANANRAQAQEDQTAAQQGAHDALMYDFYINLIDQRVLVSAATQQAGNSAILSAVYRPEQLTIDTANVDAILASNAEKRAEDAVELAEYEAELAEREKKEAEEKAYFEANQEAHFDETKDANGGAIAALVIGLLLALALGGLLIYKCVTRKSVTGLFRGCRKGKNQSTILDNTSMRSDIPEKPEPSVTPNRDLGDI